MNYKDLQIRDLNKQIQTNNLFSKNLTQQQQVNEIEKINSLKKKIILLSFQNQNIQDHLGFQNLNYSYFHKILDNQFKSIFQSMDNFLKLDYIQLLPQKKRALSNIGQKSTDLSLNKSNKSLNKSVKSVKSQSQIKQQKQVQKNIKQKPQLQQNQFTPQKHKSNNNSQRINNSQKSSDQKTQHQQLINQKKYIRELQIQTQVKMNIAQNKVINNPLKTRQNYIMQDKSPFKKQAIKEIKQQLDKKRESENSQKKQNSPFRLSKSPNQQQKSSINIQTQKIQEIKNKQQEIKNKQQEIKNKQSPLKNQLQVQQKSPLKNQLQVQQKSPIKDNKMIPVKTVSPIKSVSPIKPQNINKNKKIRIDLSYEKSPLKQNKMTQQKVQLNQKQLNKNIVNDQKQIQKQIQSQTINSYQHIIYQQFLNNKTNSNIEDKKQLDKKINNNFIKLLNNDDILNIISQFIGEQLFQVLYFTCKSFQQNIYIQNNYNKFNDDFKIKKLNKNELIKRNLKLLDIEELNILNQNLIELKNTQLNQKLEKILIIYFIIIDKLIYLNIDTDNFIIQLERLDYFNQITIQQIFDNFQFQYKINQHKLYLIKLILQEIPLKDLFNLQHFKQIQQDQYYQQQNSDIISIAQQFIESLILNQLIEDNDIFLSVNENITKLQMKLIRKSSLKSSYYNSLKYL